MWTVLISLIPGILKDKKHYPIFISMIIIIVISFGFVYEVFAAPLVTEIKATQLSQYEIIINKLDKLDEKLNTLDNRVYELNNRDHR